VHEDDDRPVSMGTGAGPAGRGQNKILDSLTREDHSVGFAGLLWLKVLFAGLL
jgi:hypothetical protein